MTAVHGDVGAWAQQAADAAELTGGDPQPPRRRAWPFVLLALVLVAAAAAVYFVVVRDQGPPHPDSWDSRVEPFVAVVEDERGLDFEQPVYVDFLSEAEFTKNVTADESDLTDADRKEIEQFTGLYRALGLVEGDLDLFDQVNDLNGAGIIGYYSYEDERIRIRGTELTPAVESTLVHELTHALQDQHFDLEAMRKDAEDDDAASSALDALIEGDARRIETEWRDGLDEAEVKALDKDVKAQAKKADRGSAKVPEVLKTLMAAPYVLGEGMLAVAVQQGGGKAVDGLFRLPPKTDEHQLDPWSMIVDHAVALPVPEPELDSADEKFDDGAFGALGWLLVLAERIPAGEALTAADGWGGDAYVAFERDGASCVRIAYTGDSPQDLTEMRSALKSWVGVAPKSPAKVRMDGSRLLFESCDPGAKAKRVASGGSQDAVRLALRRTYLSTTLARTGLETAMARCSADLLVRRLTIKQVNDPALDPKLVQRIVAPCGEQA